MATKKTAESQSQQDSPQDDERAQGVADPEATDTADTALAAEAGITEGEVKALRDEAGVNQLAGHQANVHAWAASPAGKEWAEGEDDRVKKYEEEAKEYEEAQSKEGLSEADAAYAEAVDKASK